MKRFSLAGMAMVFFFCVVPVVWATAADTAGGIGMHGGQQSDIAVALVNGNKITFGELVSKMRQIQATKYGQEKLTESLGEKLKKEAMDKLILEEIVCQLASEMGVTVEPAKVDAFIAEKKAQQRDEEHFLKYLEVMGMDMASYRKTGERLLIMQAVVDREINEKVNEVSEADARKVFELTREQYVQQEQVQVTDVVFFLDPADQASFKKVMDIREKIVNEFEGDPVKLPEDQMYHVRPDIKVHPTRQAALFAAARVLEPNQLSGVINADETLHLAKLTGYRPRIEKSFEEAQPTVKSKMLEQMRKQALARWIDMVSRNAEVKMLDATVQ